MAVLMLVGWLILSQATPSTGSGAAPGDESGEAPPQNMLALMDWYLGRIHDQTSTLELTIGDSDGLSRTYALRFSIREGQSTMDVQSPADLRGLRTLTLSRDRTYAIFPYTYRLRRIASRPFTPLFGSSFTYEDFLHFPLAQAFDATLVPIDANRGTLRALAKPGSPSPYHRIDMDMVLATMWVYELRYYDAHGRLLRTETREEPMCDQDICLPAKRRIVDHTRHDLASEARIRDLKINAGLPASQFSVNGMRHFY